MVSSVIGLCLTDLDTGGGAFIERWNFALHESDITIAGIFNSLPLIIFAYMYQPNIPAIYHEMKDKSMFKMKKVLAYGTMIASISYILTGVFGYVTFVQHPNVDVIMNRQNILKADYGPNVIIKTCLIGVLSIVLFAAPFALLPVKDSIEELVMKRGQKFSLGQNFILTLSLIFISFLIAVFVPTFGDVLTILGATTNSGIGFLIPIIFYLKIREKDLKNKCSAIKIICYIVFATICTCSLITLVGFLDKKNVI